MKVSKSFFPAAVIVFTIMMPLSSCTKDGGENATRAPNAPDGIVAVAASSSAISLSWVQPIDDVAVAGYKIYRDGTEISTPTTTAFKDSGLTPGTAYSYSVAAYDAAGNASPQSYSASATTLA